jgi:hypothetical protein
MMKVSREFESLLEFFSQPQVLYTLAYSSNFYFLGFGKEWEMIFDLVETSRVAYPKCKELKNLHKKIILSTLLWNLINRVFFSYMNF